MPYKNLGILWFQAAKTVYHAYLNSVMSYGLLLWGNAAEINRIGIFCFTKEAIKIYTILGLLCFFYGN